jgi:diacylglycerol kinase (ATP)
MACADTAVLDGTTFQPTLGILPVGTGNDISRGIDSSARFDEQAFVTALQDRSTRVVDVGRVVVDDGVHYFLGVASCGFDSDVNERANAMPAHVGRARYLLSLVRELPVLRPRWYAIDTDGVDNSMAAMIVAVGNGPAYGSGMLVCPEADVGDGLLDITVVTDTPKRTFVSVLPRVYSGRHVHHPSVVSWRGRRFRIDAPDSLVFADGERIGLLPATIEAVPSALRVVTGPGT